MGSSTYRTIKKRRESGAVRTESDIYVDEYKVLCQNNVYEDRYSSHFVDVPNDFKNYFETISVVDRLVVTMALRGFTRVNPWDGVESKLAPLSREKKEWLPAVELSGEGIFIKFKKEAIENWLKIIGKRYSDLTSAHNESFLTSPKYSAQYVMLHTFTHLLIRQLANECGYSAASVSEKIYSTFTDGSNDAEMFGVLVYLSSSDSDGSLGGLINVAEHTNLLEKVLKDMLKEARWCSGDPLCASMKHQGFSSLNYSACHACTLLPETSCEFRNVLLDRVSIVGTTDHPELGMMWNIVCLL